MGKKRIEWIDNAKGVAIILVILGHVLPDGLFHKIIYSFHMPLFFILSGMFLIRSTNKSSVWEFSKKKFMRLYIPYVLFGYMILLPFDFIWCNYIVALPDMNKEILGRAFGTIPALRNDWPLYGHLWFLPCLFIASIIIYGLWKRCKTPQMFYIFCFLGFIVGVIWNESIHTSLPLSADIAFLSLPFLSLGVFIFQHDRIFNLYLLFGGIIAFFGSVYFNTVSPTMYTGTYGSYLLFLISGISGSYIVMYLCYKLPVIKLLQIGGGNTLTIYALHNCLLPFLKYGNNMMADYGEICVGIYSVIVSIIGYVILLPVCKIINRYFPIMVGKYPKRAKILNISAEGRL